MQLTDNRTKEVFYDKLTFIYLEMPKFNKREDELHGMFEKWLFVLRNLSRLMERPPALQERIFTRLFEAAEIAKFTKEEYDSYEDSLKVYRDWKNTIATAVLKAQKEGMERGMRKGMKKGMKEGMEKGMKEGMEKGLQEGRDAEKREIARNMKASGMDTSLIVQLTGLSETDVDGL